MPNHDGKMRLGYIMDPYGNHTAAWTDPKVAGLKSTDIAHYKRMARALEAAKFDVLFVADFPSLPDGPFDNVSRSQFGANVLEPLTLLSALAGATDQIGLVGTASTSYCEPYNVARSFASLDHISGGRAGWNAVTTRWRAAAHNFGATDLDQHEARYRRAVEFVGVVRDLWDSWDDDAFVQDQDAGRYFDPEKMHLANFDGEFFKVRGPLNIARPPQGHPLITQAGGSEDGKDLAAASADLVFSITPSIEAAKAYYDDMKARVAAAGRNPDHLKVMTGITVVVAPTRAEAEAKAETVARGLHEDVGRAFIAQVLDINLDAVPYDSVIPAEIIPEKSNKGQTYFAAIRRLAVEEKRTLRQLAQGYAEARIGVILKGTATEVADELQRWYEAGATDGFMLKSNVNPEGVHDICTLLVPELQRRGLMRSDYEAGTLRNNLGLPNVPNRFTKSA